MAKRSNITLKDVIAPFAKTEPTHEEVLKDANEQSLFYFNHLEREATKKMIELRSLLADPSQSISRTISWKADEVLKAEVQLQLVTGFKMLQQADRDGDAYTPWEAAKYIYLNITSALLDMSSFGGEDITSNSSSSARNAMTSLRREALSSIRRWDLSFINHYTKKLGDNFLSTEKVR
jgi:hypothetical protein